MEEGPDEVEVGFVDEGIAAGFETHVGDEEGEAGEVDGDFGGGGVEGLFQGEGPVVESARGGVGGKEGGERGDVFGGGFGGYGDAGGDFGEVFGCDYGGCVLTIVCRGSRIVKIGGSSGDGHCVDGLVCVVVNGRESLMREL